MSRKKDLIAVSIIFLVIIIRFSPFVFSGIPVNPDSWREYYPWRADYEQSEIKSIEFDINMQSSIWFPMLKEEISKGHFPHWNPYSNCGTPLYATHLTPVFHIPLALAMLWPTKLVCTAYIFLMALTGTLLFYWFLRNFGLSVFVALFGALTFFFGGWMLYMYPPEVAAFIWIPGILLFHDRFLISNKLFDACLCAFCVGQELIAGYPIHVAHLAYLVAFYILWRRFHPSFNWNAPVKRWIIAMIIIVFGGAFISLVQNIPTYEYMKVSNRSLNSEKKEIESAKQILERRQDLLEKTGNESGLKSLLLFQLSKKALYIKPDYDVDIYATRLFIGPIAILLALIGLFLAPTYFRAMKGYLLVMAVLSMVSPLYTMIAKFIPGWGITPFLPHESFMFLTFFFAAIGLDIVIKQKGRSKAGITLASIFLVLPFLLYLIPRLHTFQSKTDFFRWNPSTDLTVEIVFLSLTTIVTIIILLKMLGHTIKPQTAYFGMVLFIAAGILAHTYLYAYFADPDPMPFTSDVNAIATLCKDGRIVRYYPDNRNVYRNNWQNYIFPPNIPAKFGIMDAFSYDSLMMGNYDKFFDTCAPGSIMRGRVIFTINDLNSITPDGFFTRSAGIKYCLSKDVPELDAKFGSSIYDGGVQIYQINSTKNAFARFVSQYELTSEYKGELCSDNFTRKILLDKKPVLPDGRVLESNDSINPEDYPQPDILRKSTSLTLTFDAPRDCILYISDTWYPRWRALLDNTEVEIIQSNTAFRAIAVPKGQHTLYMWYDGIEVLVGGIISAFTLLVLVLIALIDNRTTKNTAHLSS